MGVSRVSRGKKSRHLLYVLCLRCTDVSTGAYEATYPNQLFWWSVMSDPSEGEMESGPKEGMSPFSCQPRVSPSSTLFREWCLESRGEAGGAAPVASLKDG